MAEHANAIRRLVLGRLHIAKPGEEATHKKRRTVRGPSNQAVNAVLQWVADAETVNRTWARNMLAVVGVAVMLLLLAFRTGLLPH